MTDRYERIRKALAMGKTQGPWGATHGDAYLIAACDPDTIRALLEELDTLRTESERLRSILIDLKDWDCDVRGGFLSIPLYLRRRMQEVLAAHRTGGEA